MAGLMLDVALIGLGVVGLTAFLAVIVNGTGNKLFSHGKKGDFLDKSRAYQENWRKVGGTKK
ncbi:hypothetical protein [Thalassobacillus pellis]|uniref:hypothetical protein n=1 Tax=Thalassobacillus pellis TaxID=748008 RepID=UPI00196199B5|nr:hypothetical protein [Thalassobacillus pellis]MBM7554027.1 hypothetical protein [Thalassobacillus pellis]